MVIRFPFFPQERWSLGLDALEDRAFARESFLDENVSEGFYHRTPVCVFDVRGASVDPVEVFTDARDGTFRVKITFRFRVRLECIFPDAVR